MTPQHEGHGDWRPADGSPIVAGMESPLASQPEIMTSNIGAGCAGLAQQPAPIFPTHPQHGKPSISECANALMQRCPIRIANDTMFVWNGREYQPNEKLAEKALIVMFPDITASQRREVIGSIRLSLDDEPMADCRYIALANGVYDLETGALSSSSPDLVVPNPIPHRYDPQAACPELDAALDQWACGRPDVRANLEEVLGLLMYRGIEFQIIPLLLGDGGNGKSTYIGLAQRMLGKGNYTVLSPSAFGRSFSRTALVGVLAVFGDDISRDRLSGEAASFLRKLASGEEIDAERKYGDLIQFTPYGTPVLSCNEFPSAKDDSAGWWRRFRVIPFDANFIAGEYGANTDLNKALATEEACQRAIALGLQGLARMIEQGDLTPLPDRPMLMDDLRRQSSSVYAFARDVLSFGTPEEQSIIGRKPGDVYKRYKTYCGEEGIIQPESRNIFTRKLGGLYRAKSTPKRDGGSTVRVFAPARP